MRSVSWTRSTLPGILVLPGQVNDHHVGAFPSEGEATARPIPGHRRRSGPACRAAVHRRGGSAPRVGLAAQVVGQPRCAICSTGCSLGYCVVGSLGLPCVANAGSCPREWLGVVRLRLWTNETTSTPISPTSRHDPALLGLSTGDLAVLNDNRAGRALEALFDTDRPAC